MVWFGKVKDGKVVLEPGTPLPEGARVRIEPLDRRGEGDSVYQLGQDAVDDDLPPDMAREHDHYLYGTPKRRPGQEG